ncbi:MAG: P-II family nitrogen regulator [Caulobacteraceae bacterium]
MKYLVAIVTAPEADDACEALLAAGMDSFTATDVRDYRQNRRLREVYKGVEYAVAHQPRVKIEVAVADELADRAVALIRAMAANEVIYVLPADPAPRFPAGDAVVVPLVPGRMRTLHVV